MKKRRYRNKRFFADVTDRKKFWIISGMIFAGLVIILITAFTLGGNKNLPGQDDEDIRLETNAVLPVNQLIERYYEAKKSCDAAMLMSLIYPSRMIDESMLRLEAELVEDYQNVVCYTLPGLGDDSYVVWVEFDYKFYGIDKAAPALNRLYAVKSTETEEYQICAAPDEKMAEYMEQLSEKEDVKRLSAKVEERLQNALEADEELMAFYNKLSNSITE